MRSAKTRNLSLSAISNENNSSIGSSPGQVRDSDEVRATQISEREFAHIKRVMRRASLIERRESDRVNCLLESYKSSARPLGNGKTSCYICSFAFGELNAHDQRPARICYACLNQACLRCAAELNPNTDENMWLCKFCVEYREVREKQQ